MLSNSVCNHTRDKQIRVPLRGRPILLITHMIRDLIGLHSVLLPLIIIHLTFLIVIGCMHAYFSRNRSAGDHVGVQLQVFDYIFL